MKDLPKNYQIDDEELEARIIMAKEWNQFEVPKEIDERITELIYWKEEEEHEVLLTLMDEFEAQECYIRKAYGLVPLISIKGKKKKLRGHFIKAHFARKAVCQEDFGILDKGHLFINNFINPCPLNFSKES
ncbi:hypothetical protein E4S40_13000 [Algoriphagus kandeliae]|uniref:Uncharacterized protein n=1 Tax=Algoriphagus kandeliae TaxID=2562278 RepID=A0A4Y9QQ98_9BACT|nr:hypothetical protein [Algoriphagus kandeliae]TFV93176.1 hypothetical protein E4S40_13000 [Algoriphagus kandeliae]